MLTKEDLNQIGRMFDGFDKKVDVKFVRFEKGVIDRIGGEVGEMIEQNLFPQFDGVHKRFDGTDARLDKLDSRVTSVESQMVTKDYLDDKLADLKDVFVLKKKPRPSLLLPQSR